MAEEHGIDNEYAERMADESVKMENEEELPVFEQDHIQAVLDYEVTGVQTIKKIVASIAPTVYGRHP
uniref:Uncharacterized protein n=1 Tax=Panagrolaimus sp. PS1159 TaxID=55785 RepID=A0AC35ESK5_9BILA